MFFSYTYRPIWYRWCLPYSRHFYRASECLWMQSAILFYQFCLSVRPSVCPMPVMCQSETNGHYHQISLIFGQRHHFSFLQPHLRYKIPRGNPLSGASYTSLTRDGFFCYKYRHLSPKRYEIGLYLLYRTLLRSQR